MRFTARLSAGFGEKRTSALWQLSVKPAYKPLLFGICRYVAAASVFQACPMIPSTFNWHNDARRCVKMHALPIQLLALRNTVPWSAYCLAAGAAQNVIAA